MEKEQKASLLRIALSALLLAAACIVEHKTSLPSWQLLLIYLVPYLVAGADVLKEAGESLLRLEALDEDFLMSVATLGALAIGFLPGAENQFPEAVFVMLFFKVGELFESIAEGRSRKSISHLMNIRPDTANVIRDGKVFSISPESLSVGESIIVKPGERVPVDGVVTEGDSNLDTVALTGESMPSAVHCGDDIFSGCVNLSGALTVRVTKPFGESTASRILDLVEHAADKKSRSENFITRFARIYTPTVVLGAVVLAVLPPLFSGNFADAFPTWLYRALTFLVVSCPCALVISVPLSFFGGIGSASRKGVLVKGSNYLDALASVGTVVFDKTGTLTKGVFEVSVVHPEKITPEYFLHLAAHVERYSTHPIALSLRNAYPKEKDDGCSVEDVTEIAGQGVCARINSDTVCVGNSKLMESVGAKWLPCEKPGTIIHMSINGEYAGHVVVSDKLKDDAVQAISSLKDEGVEKTVMLTGDRKDVAKSVADSLGMDEYHAELLPADKVKWLEKLMGSAPAGRKTAFVGDGINDAPVLARADVGIAMGGLGSDAAIEAADVVLMDDKPSKIAEVIAVARRTLRIARENTVFAIAVKVIVLVLAGFGLAGMWMAVFADVGVTFLAVLNAMRALN